MTQATKFAPNGRGCGERSKGGTYLCLGIGPGGTLKIEDLILDRVKIWPGEWQRGFKILPNKRGWNDVGIFVGSNEFYPSLWDFVEEARLFGISRKVPPSFPFSKLIPGYSRIIFFHRKAYPKFTSMDADLYWEDITLPLKGCKMAWDQEVWKKAAPGWHPKFEKETFCTFAHQHFAGIIHDSYYDQNGKFEIKMPSFSYSGYMPCVTCDDNGNRINLEWQIGAFMVAPLSHIEMPHKRNEKVANEVNKAGFEVMVTDF